MPTPLETVGRWLARRVWGLDKPAPEAIGVEPESTPSPPPSPPSADDLNDVEALAGTLNRSAERVQTLWFGFLTISVYFALSVTSTTPRMLFLEEPLALPLINLTLHLRGFYIVGPILYLVLHAYFLMMLVLLARTAHSFDDALRRALPPATHAAQHERMRMRIENTLFVQMIAGGLRERAGANGRVLRIIALLTVAVAPILVLLCFQLRFLPYHDEAITLGHRLLIIVDLLLVLFLWPSYLRAWGERLLPRPRRPAVAFGLMTFIFSSLMATFPNERLHRNVVAEAVDWFAAPLVRLAIGPRYIARGSALSVHLFGTTSLLEPDRPPNIRWDGLFPNRLLLAGEDLVDDAKLNRIIEENSHRRNGEQPAFIHSVAGRDFTGAELNSADLRRIDFKKTTLTAATFAFARLEGARFEESRGIYVSFAGAKLTGVPFGQATLGQSYFGGAALQGADFFEAKLVDAHFDGADARGATFTRAQMQRARLYGGSFHGASFHDVRLDLADLEKAVFDGATLTNVTLHGAKFGGAKLRAVEAYSVSAWLAKDLPTKDICMASPAPGWTPPWDLRTPPDATPSVGKLIEWLVMQVPEPDKEAIAKALTERLRSSEPDAPPPSAGFCSEQEFWPAITKLFCADASSAQVARTVIGSFGGRLSVNRPLDHDRIGEVVKTIKAARAAAAEKDPSNQAANAAIRACRGALALTDDDILGLEDLVERTKRR